MGAIKDLFASERGLFAIVLVIAATVLAALSLMTVTQWQDFSMTIFGIFVGGKTVTTSVALIATKGAAAKPAEVPPALIPPAPPTP
jgi:uncharacterized membrane protein YadS